MSELPQNIEKSASPLETAYAETSAWVQTANAALRTSGFQKQLDLPQLPIDPSPAESVALLPMVEAVQRAVADLRHASDAYATERHDFQDLAERFDAAQKRCDKLTRQLEHLDRPKKQPKAPDAYNAGKERRHAMPKQQPSPSSEIVEVVDAGALRAELGEKRTTAAELGASLTSKKDRVAALRVSVDERFSSAQSASGLLAAQVQRLQRLRPMPEKTPPPPSAPVLKIASISRSARSSARQSVHLPPAAIDEYFSTINVQPSSAGYPSTPVMIVNPTPAAPAAASVETQRVPLADADAKISVISASVFSSSLLLHLIGKDKTRSLDPKFVIASREALQRKNPAWDIHELLPALRAYHDALSIAYALAASPVRTAADKQSLEQVLQQTHDAINGRQNAFQQKELLAAGDMLDRACRELFATLPFGS